MAPKEKASMLTKPTGDPLSMPCWVWSRARDHAGYGGVYCDGHIVGAHRWVYQQLVGPIPDGLHLDHLCRNPSCVNPDHLEPVTVAENVRRGSVRKLTMEAAEEIRREHARGVSMAHLALHHGVSTEAI